MSVYSAVLTKAGRKVRGQVRLEDRRIVFTGSSGEPDLVWDEFGIAVFRARRGIFLRSTLDDSSMEVLGQGFEKELRDGMGVEIQHAAFSTYLKSEWSRVVLLLGGFFVVAVVSMILVRWQSERLSAYIPAEAEQSIGRRAFEQSFAPRIVALPEDLQPTWKALIDRVVANERLNGHNVEIHLVKEPVANAFAFPGGFVAVTTELVLKAESPEEILGVVAHELGHVIHRHAIKGLAGDIGMFVFAGLLFGVTDVYSVAALSATRIHQLEYSREQELDADITGLHILSDAKISHKGLKDFFSRPKELPGEKVPRWLSTHPLDEERVANIEKRAASAGETVPIDFDLAAIKRFLEPTPKEK